MYSTKKILITTIILIACSCLHAQSTGFKNHPKNLLVFFDGLRPDYITPEQMPNLYAFKQTAAYGKQHHSVFPTVTRVNAASYATGSYPATHGLMGNTVYFPAVNPVAALNTGSALDLKRIDSAENGHLLLTPSIGEILSEAGQRMAVFSSGSTGQALLQNHKVGRGFIINPDMILPVAFKDTVVAALGQPPITGEDNSKKHIWITEALIRFGLTENGPPVCAIWYSDPDGAAHKHGIGSPEAIRSLKTVDEQFGRILQFLDQQHLRSSYNIIVSADHGFVTYSGSQRLTSFLIERQLKKDKTSDDVVVADGAIYVKDHNQIIIKKIVEVLQQQEWIGAIFTPAAKPGNKKGEIPGTLSFESVHYNNPFRSGDILAVINWNDNKNSKGYAGASYSTGVAGHGGISPYEIHIALMASGPSFKKNYESDIPTSNIDIVPTLLHILKLQQPAAMNGRVMSELLSDNVSATIPKVTRQIITTSVDKNGIRYKLTLQRSVVANHYYIDFCKTTRIKLQQK